MRVLFAGSWVSLVTTPTRAGGRSTGSSSLTSRKWPRWLTPNVDSKPSAVLVMVVPACIPALQTRACSGGTWPDLTRPVSSVANARTEARDARSSAIASTVRPARATLASSPTAAAARPASREATTTCHGGPSGELKTAAEAA